MARPVKRTATGAPAAPIDGETEAARALAERLEALNCDPVEIIARIARNRRADPRLRFAAARELLGLLMGRGRGPGGGAPVDVAAIIARAWRPAGKG
ncbi:MAG TPA: hypothetical protein VGC25_06015 [Alphaproteobacteria bacterium]|jgi:hypothetical protein